MRMFDVHCHSLFSDGELLPSELVRRLEVKGYDAIAISDHADESNFDLIIERISRVAQEINRFSATKLIAGIELTHVHPERIASLTEQARKLGAKVVVCHGETLVEPVIPGTNRAAIEAGVDVLAHPGLISEEDVALAAARGVRLELSARKGHGITNGHVCRLARRLGAQLIVNSDAHAPGDFMEPGFARAVASGAGLDPDEAERIFEQNWAWISTLL